MQFNFERHWYSARHLREKSSFVRSFAPNIAIYRWGDYPYEMSQVKSILQFFADFA